jgi:hypothetical protein
VPLASRWRHHSTATPATTTNGTTAICTMIQPAPDSIAPEANDDSVTVPNTSRLVIPELQRRGLYRREYEGLTLRENLGLGLPQPGWWK